MPLCGFDKLMLDGLSAFYNGLAKAVRRKSVRQNITIAQAIEIELREMNEFIAELPNLTDDLSKQKLTGITHYAQSFYREVLKKHNETKEEVNKIMETIIKETRNFLYMVDKMYEERFRKMDSSMKELVSWINKGEQNATIRV